MFSQLKRLFQKGRDERRERIDEEYTAMTPDERHEAEMLRRRGPEGERELIVEHQAERREEADEARPRDM